MKKRFWFGILASLVAILTLAYAFLIRESHVPDRCDFKVDLVALRSLASSIPGEKPSEVRVEDLGQFSFPEAAVVTGHPWSPTTLPMYSYQVSYPDRTLLIDTAMTEEQGKGEKVEHYKPEAWQRLSKAMSTASAIYVTHEHTDHLGGLAAQIDSPGVAEHAHLSRAQLTHPAWLENAHIPVASLQKLKPFDLDSMLAVAPGVVLVKANGHSPGSQLVFVQQQNGTEFLILGDAAWHTANVDEVKGPPRLITFMLHNNREETSCELAAFHKLAESEPKLIQIPGHDGPRINQLIAQGVLVPGFR